MASSSSSAAAAASSSLLSSRTTSSSTSSSIEQPSHYRFVHSSSPGRKVLLDHENKAERRRAQNRLSQQAYRKRKNQHAWDLEVEVAECSEKYRTLAQAHTLQTEEVRRLKEYLEGLVAELDSRRRRRGVWVEEFDLVSLMVVQEEEKQWTGGAREGMRDYFDGYAAGGDFMGRGG